MNRLTSWLSLFASTSTLLCCALPSLLVTLGMGASMAGLVTTIPQLVWISQYKLIVFIASGSLLLGALLMHHQARNAPCPIDPELARRCQATRRWSFVVLCISLGIWSVGFFFAYVAIHIF